MLNVSNGTWDSDTGTWDSDTRTCVKIDSPKPNNLTPNYYYRLKVATIEKDHIIDEVIKLVISGLLSLMKDNDEVFYIIIVLNLIYIYKFFFNVLCMM